MEEIQSLLRSPGWWFSTVFASVLVGLFTNFLSHHLQKLFAPKWRLFDVLVCSYLVLTPISALVRLYYYGPDPYYSFNDGNWSYFTDFYLTGVGMPLMIAVFLYIPHEAASYSKSAIKITFALFYLGSLGLLVWGQIKMPFELYAVLAVYSNFLAITIFLATFTAAGITYTLRAVKKELFGYSNLN